MGEQWERYRDIERGEILGEQWERYREIERGEILVSILIPTL